MTLNWPIVHVNGHSVVNICYNPQTEQHERANAALSVDCNYFVVSISYMF